MHCTLLFCVINSVCAEERIPTEPVDGFRGIWYSNQKSDDQYRWKYSGGMATYPQQHVPIAQHAAAPQKTFFVYGGAEPGQQRLQHMLSYFDHQTGQVARPRKLLDKETSDAHDNPTLTIDAQGHLWVFSNSHGTSRPSYIHRSTEPYSIDEFERVATTNFSYGQPWYVAPHDQFLFLHTRYRDGGRSLFAMSSADGRDWSEPALLARFGAGHYQVSWTNGPRVATCFNYHPSEGGLNARTNLYYIETADAGKTWQTVEQRAIALPLEEPDNPALVHDYQSEGLLVYLKDMQFDAEGNPVLLYLTSRGYASGPAADPRTWRIARWNGEAWQRTTITTSDHNYDYGSLYIEPDGVWRLIAPTEPGAQPYTTGGQMAMWTSNDAGATWKRIKLLTHDQELQHTFARRPVNAHPDFYALWADGNALEPSSSRLYFTDRWGTQVWRLPEQMTSDHAVPAVAW